MGELAVAVDQYKAQAGPHHNHASDRALRQNRNRRLK